MRLSVVIPAFNEVHRLPATLVEIIRYLEDHPRWLPAEILVVDDGSNDDTAAVVNDNAVGDDIDLKCLIHTRNRGKGAASRTGFAAARGDVILLSDADLSTPIEEIERLGRVLTDGAVIGSRAIDRSRIENPQPGYRDLMGRTFNLVVRTLAVRGVLDTQCGFKLFAGDLGRKIAAVQRIDGFAFDVELLVLARSWGYEIQEIPVRWRHVEESRVQPVTHSAEMFIDLLRIAGWRLTGRVAAEPSSER